MFLLTASLAANGQTPVWQQAISGGFHEAQAMAADTSGNMYIAGLFRGTATFGTISLTAPNASTSSLYIAKWSRRTRRFQWAQQVNGMVGNAPVLLAVNGRSIYLAGGFTNTVAFGPHTLTSLGFNDVYVTKLTDAGTSASFTWAQQAGGTNSDEAHAIAVNGNSVYIAGHFAGSVNTTGSSAYFGSTALNAVRDYDAFVAKLTDAGPSTSFAWATSAGGTGYDNATTIAVQGNNVYVAGYFVSPALTLGGVTLTNTNASQPEIFVTKLTDAGSSSSYTWATRAGGPGIDYVTALAVQNNHLYLGGTYSAGAAFGPTTLPGSYGIYTAKLTDGGPAASFNWAQRAGGAGSDRINAIIARSSGVYIAGSFGSEYMPFGSILLVKTTPSPSTSTDAYVAKLLDAGSSTSFEWAKQAGGTGNDAVNGMAFDGNDIYVTGIASANALFDSLTVTGSGFIASLGRSLFLTNKAAPRLQEFEVVPVPAHGTAMVQVPALTAVASAATLALTDALGRTVRTQAVALRTAASSHALDLTGLAPGLYTLHLRAGPTQAVRKLVVE